MKIKNKPALIGLIVCIALMFLLILPTVLLTGGKEMNAFTSADWTVFTVFVILEVITFIVMFILAVKVGKSNRQNVPEIKPGQQSFSEKLSQIYGILIFILAYIGGLGSTLLGIIWQPKLPAALARAVPWIFAIAACLPLVLLAVNLLFKRIFAERLNSKKLAQLQAYLLSHRENAAYTATKKLRLLKLLRLLNNLYTASLIFIGAAIGIFGVMVTDSDLNVPITFYAAFMFLCGLSRLRFYTPARVYEEETGYLPEKDYPRLYALAKKAAKALQCHGRIKLVVMSNSDAHVINEGGYYCIRVGVILLSLLSEEEFYAVLLHELSHVRQEQEGNAHEMRYYNWLASGGNQHYMSNITALFYLMPEILYMLQYELYRYAASILWETESDRAMAEHGNPKAAASALIKLNYCTLFDWEIGTFDDINVYEPEQPDPHYITSRIKELQAAIDGRKDAWNALLDREILSRSASHPTLKMRLQTLGIAGYDVLDHCPAGQYDGECQALIDHVNRLVLDIRSKDYQEKRQEYYLQPKELVQHWEADGCPVIAEQYADVIGALQQLGQNNRAKELCLQVIDTFSGAAAVHAHYMLGCYLLHSYDDKGLEHIYHAIENNKNYIEEGLDIIGSFCCLTGNQEELDVYREKALELAQKDKDLYSHIGTLNKTDHLQAEQLPEGMLESILTYIRSIENGTISRIYLVRKIISEDFFTSAFVIRFRIGVDEEEEDRVMHKIFSHLDTCSDWQFSLFDYRSVISVNVDQIEGSCVYTQEETDNT